MVFLKMLFHSNLYLVWFLEVFVALLLIFVDYYDLDNGVTQEYMRWLRLKYKTFKKECQKIIEIFILLETLNKESNCRR